MYKFKAKINTWQETTVLVLSLKDNNLSSKAKDLPFKPGTIVQYNEHDWEVTSIDAFQTMEGEINDSIGLRVLLKT